MYRAAQQGIVVWLGRTSSYSFKNWLVSFQIFYLATSSGGITTTTARNYSAPGDSHQPAAQALSKQFSSNQQVTFQDW